MDLGSKTNLRNQCLTLTKASPKTPKLNPLEKRAAKSPSAFTSCTSTPENCKFLNIFDEESPTHNYYDYCTLSQKMLIDEDRDVVWNWEKHKNPSEVTTEIQNLREFKVKTKLIPSINQERKRVKPNYSCKGLYKLQALQKEKKSINKNIQNTFDSLLIHNDQEQKKFKELNNTKFKHMADQKEILGSIKDFAPKSKASIDSGIENTLKDSKTEVKAIEDLFCDEEDSILFRHSQKIETCNQYSNKDEITPIQNKTGNENIDNRVVNLNSNSLEKPFSDEKQAALEKDDSFDDYFLSIDLSSINDNKRFQRHNSMPSNYNENKSNAMSFARHFSSGNFSNEIGSIRKDLVISPISDITDISVESFDSAVSCQETSSNKHAKRCSKEEVEAKRLEAKRKRLLKMNKISSK